MRKAKLYIYNGLLVSGVSLVLRFAAMAYTVYISGKLGAEGMGLLTLVTSVYSLALTLAVSGIGLTCTRLTADALALKNPKDARKSLMGCAVYALCFGLFSAALLFSLSSFLGNRVLGDARTVLCLRALCPALPVAALNACFQGYFTSSRRVWKTAFPSSFEQASKILFTAFLFSFLLPRGYGVEAVMFSSCFAEFFSFALLCLILFFDVKKHLPKSGCAQKRLPRRLLSISLPIAAAAWVRSALVTAEHILIPKGLKAYGKGNALATYGVMHGMALPVIFFPYAVITPFTSLLMPEIARFKAEKKEKDISFCASLMLRMTLLFALGCAGYLIFFGKELGAVLYAAADAQGEVGKMIAFFAVLVPVMYTDTATDSVLKGLGEQVYCMKVNILDAALSLLLVVLLVPRVGAVGYLITVFVSECVNTFFSVLKLKKKTGLSVPVLRSIALPALCAVLSAFLSRRLFLLCRLPARLGLVLAALVFLLIYLPILCLTGALQRGDRRYFKRLFLKK